MERASKKSTTKPEPTQPKNRPSVSARIGLIVAILAFSMGTFYLVSFLLSFPFSFLLHHTSLSRNLIQTIYSLLTYAIVIAILILVPKLINKKWKSTRESLGLLGLPTFADLGLAPAGFIVATVLAGIATMLLSNFSWFDATESQAMTYNLAYAPERLIALFSLAIVAPIAEEIIFRGYLYGKLKKYSSAIVATILTSLAFGAMHLIINSTGIHQLNAAVNVFIMSLVLCVLREISDSIYAGILMHMIKNIIAFFILYNMMY